MDDINDFMEEAGVPTPPDEPCDNRDASSVVRPVVPPSVAAGVTAG